MATMEEVARGLTVVRNLSQDVDRALTMARKDLEVSLGELHHVLRGTGQAHVLDAVRGMDAALTMLEEAAALIPQGRGLIHKYAHEKGFGLGSRRPLELDLPLYSALRIPARVRRRAGAQKPPVEDPDLRRVVDSLYNAITKSGRVGDGTTMDAIWNERAGGGRTAGKFHLEKGRQAMKTLRGWTERHPSASAQDRAVARDLYRQIQEALGEDR